MPCFRHPCAACCRPVSPVPVTVVSAEPVPADESYDPTAAAEAVRVERDVARLALRLAANAVVLRLEGG